MIPPGAYEDSWPERPWEPGVDPHPSEVEGVSFEYPDDCLLSWGDVDDRCWTRRDDLAFMEALLAHKRHRLREVRLGPRPPSGPPPGP